MDDTIVAIATTIGIGAINIIRISGKQSINIVNSIFIGKDLTKVNGNTINYGHIVYKNEIIDEVLISVFRSPKSFTTEDMIEINCHGGVSSVNKIIEILLSNGMRIAEPGEFLKRAFLNGRIDLTEAEAVQDLIEAKTEGARKLSVNAINGKIFSLINDLRDEILNIIANIEVNIDYPEYEDTIVTNKLIKNELKNFKEKINNLLIYSEEGKIIKEGIKVAIVGRPNVGKSSLLNRILNAEKAIVTDVPGTTRDIVEGSIILNGIEVRFFDTAGIRNANNQIEKLGIEKTLKEIKNASLILIIFSANEKLNEEDKRILNLCKSNNKLIVLNKIDLKNICDLKEDYIEISALNNLGIETLKDKIIEKFNLNELESENLQFLSNIRQINILKECVKIVKEIEKDLEKNISVDLIETNIKILYNKLGEITGQTYESELLDKIFSKFCLGK